MNDFSKIIAAREKFLSRYEKEIAAGTLDLNPGSQALDSIARGFGMEFLAICHDDDAITAWVNRIKEITKTPYESLMLTTAALLSGAVVITMMKQHVPYIQKLLEESVTFMWEWVGKE